MLGALSRRPAVVAVLAYAFIAAAVVAPSLRPGRTLVPADILNLVEPWHTESGAAPVHNAIVSDAAFQFFPWWTSVARDMRRGDIPEWNPGILGGVPVNPNGYVSVWYPPFWLARWMSVFDAYDIFILLHLVLAASGIYALTRVVGVRPIPSWLAGLGALTGGMWVHWSFHLVHLVGMAWMPLVFAAGIALMARPSARRAALLAGAFGLWWLGANPQYAYYGTLALAALLAVMLLAKLRTGFSAGLLSGFYAAAALVIGSLLAAPVLVPTVSSAGSILRVREEVGAMTLTHLTGPHRILAVLPEAAGSPPDHVAVPHEDPFLDSPFVSVTGLILIAGSLGARRRIPGRWLLTVLSAAVVVLGTTAFAHPLLHALVPGYDRFRTSSRWLSVLPAAGLPLAGIGWEALREGQRMARLFVITTSIGVGTACVIWYNHHHRIVDFPIVFFQHRVAFTIAVALVVLAASLAAQRQPALAVAVVVIASLAEIAVHTPQWYPSIEKARAYRTTAVGQVAHSRGGRIVRLGASRRGLPTYAPDVPLVDDVEDAQGQAVLFPRRTDHLLRLVDDYGDFALAQNTAPEITTPQGVASPILDALDVRTVIVESPGPSPSSSPIFTSGPTSVFPRESLGSAFLVPEADAVSEGQMWQRVAAPTWKPDMTAAVVGLEHPIHGGGGSVQRVRRTSSEDEWRVDAPRGGFLRVSAAYARGWTARVDGHHAAVKLADGIFRGVAVPPGTHDVVFRYRNPSERRGEWLGVVGILLTLGLLVPNWLTRFRRAESDHVDAAASLP